MAGESREGMKPKNTSGTLKSRAECARQLENMYPLYLVCTFLMVVQQEATRSVERGVWQGQNYNFITIGLDEGGAQLEGPPRDRREIRMSFSAADETLDQDAVNRDGAQENQQELNWIWRTEGESIDQACARRATALGCGTEGAKQQHFQCQVLLMTQASGTQSLNSKSWTVYACGAEASHWTFRINL